MPESGQLDDERPRKVKAAGIGGILAAIANVVTIAAGAVAIAGIWVWIDEKSDRDDERRARREEADARRASLIADAQQILRSQTGVVLNTGDSTVTWAIDTLQRYNQPIFIKANVIDLEGLDLKCATLVVTGRAVSLASSRIRNSRVNVDAAFLNVAGSGVVGSEFDMSQPITLDPFAIIDGLEETRPRVEFVSSKLVSTEIAFRLVQRPEAEGFGTLVRSDRLDVLFDTSTATDLVLFREPKYRVAEIDASKPWKFDKALCASAKGVVSEVVQCPSSVTSSPSDWQTLPAGDAFDLSDPGCSLPTVPTMRLNPNLR